MGQIVFLLYDSRSGSTLLSRLLDEYVDVGVSIESDLMVSLARSGGGLGQGGTVDQLLQRARGTARLDHLRVDEDALRARLGGGEVSIAAFVEAVLEMYFALDRPDADVWVVKDGANGFHVHQIAAALPGARFIHVLRDGRAVLNSRSKTERPYAPGETMARDALTAARLWTDLLGNVDAFSARHPGRMLEVRYEELIVDPPRVLGDIRTFVGLPRDGQRTADGPGYEDRIVGAERGIHTLVGSSPQAGRIEAWKAELDPVDRRLFELAAGDVLRDRGYSDIPALGPLDLLRDAALARAFAVAHGRRARSWIGYLGRPRFLARTAYVKYLRSRDRRC